MAFVQTAHPRRIVIWLFCLCFLVVGTLVVGGLTRLTHSGLSIVEWKPITGVIPPLTEHDWLSEFAKYQGTPEFQKVNAGMSLQDFKFIYSWEWTHRLLGRLIGVVFMVPFVWFAWRKYFSGALGMRLCVGLILGGLQGLMGWYMVKSGLVNEPRVSHLRLAAHLSLALLILVYFYWIIMDIWPRRASRQVEPSPNFLRWLSYGVCVLVAVQIVFGAFTAGLKAGHMYNTFPLMDGQFLPTGWNYLQPLWNNFVFNALTVQWVHRTMAWTLLGFCIVIWGLTRVANVTTRQKFFASLLWFAVMIQFTLGVLTLLHVVPIELAIVHQLGAVGVLLAGVGLAHSFRRSLTHTPTPAFSE